MRPSKCTRAIHLFSDCPDGNDNCLEAFQARCYPDCIVNGFITIDDGISGVVPPKMKVGDRVRPTTMIPVSNKKMMFEDE